MHFGSLLAVFQHISVFEVAAFGTFLYILVFFGIFLVFRLSLGAFRYILMYFGAVLNILHYFDLIRYILVVSGCISVYCGAFQYMEQLYFIAFWYILV